MPKWMKQLNGSFKLRIWWATRLGDSHKSEHLVEAIPACYQRPPKDKDKEKNKQAPVDVGIDMPTDGKLSFNAHHLPICIVTYPSVASMEIPERKPTSGLHPTFRGFLQALCLKVCSTIAHPEASSGRRGIRSQPWGDELEEIQKIVPNFYS